MSVLSDPAQLTSISADWDRLDRDRPSPESELDWVRASATASGGRTRLAVVASFEDGRLTGVAPLVQPGGRVPRLVLSDDAGGFLYADHASLRRLANAVAGLGLPMRLDPLIAGGATERALDEAIRGTHVVRSVTRLGGPSLPLDPDQPDPAAKLSSSRTKDLRRRMRRAREAGPVAFDVQAPGAQLATLLDELKAIEAAGWKGREGTALRDDAAQDRVLTDYLTSPAVLDRVRIARLCIGDTTAAMDLGVIAANRYWSMKTTYDERFGRCSPGHLMTAELLRWAANQGIERFEFGGTTAPAKELWGAPPTELRALKAYPRTAAGMAALSGDVGGKASRTIARSLSRFR